MMGKLKGLLKAHAPRPILNIALIAYKKNQEFSSSRYDRRIFGGSRFRGLPTANQAQLEGKLVFHAHSLEKGLSHADIRFNFGRSALQSLGDTIRAYIGSGFPLDSLPYLNALATLGAYESCHDDAGVDPHLYRQVLGPDLIKLVHECESDIGGSIAVGHGAGGSASSNDFAAVVRRRSSIREFADIPMSVDRIAPSIQLSMKAPSVCNRQSARVKIVLDESKIERLLEIQGGMVGYKAPPALLVVTSDVSSFLEPTERNQPFVDGGLFAMCLLLSLEYEGLAACPLNTMMPPKAEEAIRRILGYSKAERLVVFIAVGEFPAGSRIPKSFRYDGNFISTSH